jgi:hypothetical protein
MILTSVQSHNLLQRFPKIELSYETIPHKKVSPIYNVCIAIPMGTKCYAWFTFYGEEDVCFIMEINKERKINKVSYTVIHEDSVFAKMNLALGTILYGSYADNKFIAEDIFFYKGIPMQGLYFGEKLGFLENMFQTLFTENNIFCNIETSRKIHELSFHLPVMWGLNNNSEYDCVYEIPQKYAENYPIHHIQYRCLADIAPHLNVYPVKKGFGQSVQNIPLQPINDMYVPFRADFSKPQYRQIAIFKVMADLQFDVYHLFAYGRNKSCVYYNVAYIPNYKISVFMNNIFRKIKENANLDAIEESDDEEDFENIDYDKYVNLNKYVFMECRFNIKFKKWVPIRVVLPEQKVVHISML